MNRKTESEIMHNCMIKYYPDGTSTVLVGESFCFRESGWESERPREYRRADRGGIEDAERARRRARAAVYDLARSNDFRYFVTLTLDAAVIDRYNISESVKRLRVWLDNSVRRKGLIYVLIPELHRDGAVHFHGFFNAALDMVDSGTLRTAGDKRPRKPRSMIQRLQMLDNGAQVVYNIPGYNLGFSTAIELYGDKLAAISYVCKYIGKDSEKIGGRWYYSGGRLQRPVKAWCDIDDVTDFVGDAESFVIPRLGCRFWKIETEA